MDEFYPFGTASTTPALALLQQLREISRTRTFQTIPTMMRETKTSTKITDMTEETTATKITIKVRALNILKALIAELGYSFTERNKLLIFEIPNSEVTNIKNKLSAFDAEYCVEYADGDIIQFAVTWAGKREEGKFSKFDPTKVRESLLYNTFFS